jgi:dihydrofolate reductase
MIISSLVAMNRSLLIGKDNDLPWHLKDDLAHFKNYSMNKPIVMGRNTYESIGRPLPNRKNIVMTKSIQGREGVTEVSSTEKALEEAIEYSKTVSVIGGEYIYKEFLPLATKLLITEIKLEVDSADTFFPKWDKSLWKENSRLERSENGIEFSFVEYVKN